MTRETLVAGKFLTAAAIAGMTMVAPRPVAADCRDYFNQDIANCASQSDACFNDPNWSWWTSTCNIQYLACLDAAMALYVFCS